MKKRKISLIMIAIAMALCMALCIVLPACSGGDDEGGETGGEGHEHSYTLKSDDTYHWEECTCGDIINKMEHSSSTWEHTRNNHWQECDTCGETFAYDAHSFDLSDTCSVCGYELEELASTTIYMVGDSTMCGFNDNRYLPRYGYGTQLYNYLTDAADYSDAEDATNDSTVTIRNLALSGRSSQTFLSESNYQTLKDNIGEGDYLVIGFGHNDEKSGDTYSDATKALGETTDNSGFQDNLYNNYVKIALDAGATPILCTPIVRYDSQHRYENSSYVHVYDYGDYPQAIRDLGEATGTTVIDLTAITAADYIELGDDAQWYHSFSKAVLADETSDSALVRTIETTKAMDDGSTTASVVPGGRDDTHLNMYGAKMVSYEFVEALATSGNSLADYIATDVVKPTIANDLEEGYKTDFKYRVYESFNPETDTSTVFTNANLPTGWYATAFGDINSASTSNYTIKYEETSGAGVFTVGSLVKDRGKLASDHDGLAAAFMQIDKDDGFTATATVKVTAALAESSYGQVGFGMMLRDDIYIDEVDTAINSNYVTAGILGQETSYANFYREDTSLSNGTKLTSAFAVNNEYQLKLVRENQTIHCTVSDSSGSVLAADDRIDVSFYEVDENYVYLCLFATRGVTVEFSNVQVDIQTGAAAGA